jgi:hypothetical protein
MGLAALVATAVVMAGAQPAMAGKAHPGFYGVFYTAQDNVGKDVRAAADSGTEHVKLTLRWNAVEPRPGVFNWARYDELIGGFASRGIQVLPMFFGSPRWAASAGNKPPTSSEAQEGWKSFVTQAVNRYGPGGTYWRSPLGYAKDHPGKAPQEVKAWQVWNEPNLQHYFATDTGKGVADSKDRHRRIRTYANLLEITSDAIKQGDPSAAVVLGGLVGNGRPSGSMNASKFLDKLYKKDGVKQSFDAAAIHPYATSVGFVKEWLRKLRSAMKQHQDSGTPVWITEISWGSDPPDRYGFTKGLQGQKKILTQALSALYKKRHTLGLHRVYWYALRDPQAGNPRCSFCGSAGLLKSNFDKKPAWKAFKLFTGG